MFIEGNCLYITFGLLNKFFPSIKRRNFKVNVYFQKIEKIGIAFLNEKSREGFNAILIPGVGYRISLPFSCGDKRIDYNCICDVVNFRLIAIQRIAKGGIR